MNREFQPGSISHLSAGLPRHSFPTSLQLNIDRLSPTVLVTTILLAAAVLSASCARTTDAQLVNHKGAGKDSSQDPKRIRRHLEHTPDWNEKPFAPADGSTIEVNPPAFVWLPVKKYTGGYLLELSRDEKGVRHHLCKAPFGPEGQMEPDPFFIKTPISVHIPNEPLPAGRWYWRAGVRMADGQIIWGDTRGFVVPEGARKWPFPKIDELVAKIPKSHPRLLFPGKRLEEVRGKRHTTLRREYAKLIAMAEAGLGKPLVAEPQFLKKQGSERGEEYAKIFRATRPPMDLMETCGLAYLLTGERRYGDEAKRRVLHFFGWDPDGSTNLFHNDEPAMWMMQRGVRAYDWCYDLFTPEERKRVESVMKARCRQFRERLRRMPFESRPYSSHPARDLGFLGEAALCFAHEWPEARDWLSYVVKVYRSVFPGWGQDDGGWQEGPSYWRAYMGFTLHFTTALEMATGEKISRRPFFQNTPYYALYTNPPGAQLSPFGDAQDVPPGRGTGRLMYCFSTLLRDPYVRWYADVTRSGPGIMPMSFALCDRELRGKPPVDLPQARVFPGAGLVAMHDDLADTEENAYLVMRSSPMGSVSHGHSDQNAFAIEARGQALAIASGYYPWYGSPHHHDWTRSTKAQNCVTTDGGQGQIRRSAKSRGRIERFVTSQYFDYARGDAAEAYGDRLDRALRHVVHVRPGTFVIIDELSASKPTSFEWNLHALEKMQIDGDKQQVRIRRKDSALLASFVEPSGLNFTQTDQFTPPPEDGGANQWHLRATTGKNSGSVFFVVMQTHASDQSPPELKNISYDGCKGVAWKDSDAEYTILYGRQGVKTPRVDSDARIVGFRTSLKGKKAQNDWLAVDATRLALDGCQCLRVEPPADVAAKERSKTPLLTGVYSSDELGARFTSDGPALVARVAVDAEPVQVRRGEEILSATVADGMVRLNVPAGRLATDIHYGAVIEEPVVVIKAAGVSGTQTTRLAGRMFNRVQGVWEYKFDGPAGKYRLGLPAELKAVKGVWQLRNGQTIALRTGERIWFYGRVAQAAVELAAVR